MHVCRIVVKQGIVWLISRRFVMESTRVEGDVTFENVGEDACEDEYDLSYDTLYETTMYDYYRYTFQNNANECNSLPDIGITKISRGSGNYPEQLISLFEKRTPEELFCYGDVSLFEKTIIMVCGARNASAAACKLAYACGRLIAEQGYTVASGYARGVDMAAHIGALEAGGSTIAILPYGLGKFRLQSEIADLMANEQFLVVSEAPYTGRFTAARALGRNKLLVKMSRAVIVVEPGESGGTWFSADYAGKKGKPLYFIEGERSDVIPKLEGIGGRRIQIIANAPDLREMYRHILMGDTPE